MAILNNVVFKNAHGDKVDVRLTQNPNYNNGEYQIIVNIEMHRRTTEKRFHAGKIVELGVYKFTHEVSTVSTTIERTALVEYMMSRTLNGDPTLPMVQFQEWLTATDKD